MLKNTLLFCLKNIRTRQSNSFFVVAGTAVTAATVLLLFTLLLSNENPNSTLIDPDRIIIIDQTLRTKEGNNWTSGLNYRLIKEQIETIQDISTATIFSSSRIQHWVNEERIESRLLYTDTRFKNFVNLKFVEGTFFTKEEFDAEANVIVISQRSAKLFFGDSPAIGKNIENQHGIFRVIGVFQDVPKLGSLGLGHSFDEIIPLTHDDILDRETSIDEGAYDYVSLVKANRVDLVEYVKKEIRDNASKFEVRPEGMTLYLTPFTTKDYLFTKLKMPTQNYLLNKTAYQFYVTSLLLITVLTVICVVNIANLTITTMLNRNIEFGVRYAFGANRLDILKQGFIESLLYGFLSLLLSYFIAELFFFVLNYIEYSRNMIYHFDLFSLFIVSLYSISVPLLSYFLAIYRINGTKPITLLKGGL